ncbi:MAG: hypothetical protein U9M95_06555 [Candidatus Altiarchaeota archaeon]|nr:hypothetical protein [Candidatus Altiarchaeota archaeon]
MKKIGFLFTFLVCLVLLAPVSANGRATSTTVSALGKGYMELSLSSYFAGEPVIATVSDRNTGTPLENVGLEVFQGAVLPTTRVFYDYTNGEGETDPFTIDEPGTYIITITREGYFYDEIPVEFTSAPTTTTSSTTTISTSSTTTTTLPPTTTTSLSTTTTTLPSTTTTLSTTTTTQGGGGGGGFFGWLWNLIMWFIRWLLSLFRGFFGFFGFH